MSEFSIEVITENKVSFEKMKSILNKALSENNITCQTYIHQESIVCEDLKEAYVGDTVRVVGKPEAYFYDGDVDIEGVITQIGWYGEDKDFRGFRINGELFLVYKGCKVTLVE